MQKSSQKNILVYLGHPAHYHLFKNVITNLKNNGNKLDILIKKKDILEDLLKNAGLQYHNILEEGRKDSTFGILMGTLKRIVRLNKFLSKHKEDILVGTSVENSFVGPLRSIPVINVNEDDADVVPKYAKLSYPGANAIIAPTVCNCGKWDEKTTKYNSYHELAYLHPNHFTANIDIVKTCVSIDKPYVIIRFAKLSAHHDDGIKGINNDIAGKIIDMLSKDFNIYITSERPLASQFEQYRIQIDPLNMHHVMAFADMYIGDSQTMAAEAGVLGIPFIRFNDFVGRIGYLKELEDGYRLGYGVKTNEPERIYSIIEELLAMKDRKQVFADRKEKMLSDKIDFAKFLTWFIENYPESKQIMNDNPDYQYNFK